MAQRSAITLLLIGSVCFAQQSPPTHRDIHGFLGLGTPPDEAAAKLGDPLYQQNCSACHGPTARGAQAPNLVRSPLVLHDEKGEAIGDVVKKGRAQAGMPAFPNLTNDQIYQIAEYIHMQVELVANRGLYADKYSNLRNQVTGDAAKGQQYFAQHCANCHSVTGDLAGIGKRYPEPSVLMTKIAWPTLSGPRQATVTTKSGETITGKLDEFNDFDVAITDSEGNHHSWSRDEVKINIPDKLLGHKALLRQYTDADLHDVTAYLIKLSSER